MFCHHGDAMSADVITLKEVAEYLKLTEKTACRLAAEGKSRVSRWVVLGVSNGAP